jgi:replication factor A1
MVTSKISELTAGKGNVDIEGVIVEVGEPRTFDKFGRTLVVANAVLKDDSGSIKLSLWNDDASRYKQSDKIKVINGYVSEFQGEKQLTSGKFGKIEKVGNQEVDDKSELSVDDPDLEDAGKSDEVEEEFF